MRRVSISWKVAQALLGYCILPVSEAPGSAVAALRAALKPRPVKKFVKAARARKATRKASKRQETKDIRAAVMLRAGNRCEGCFFVTFIGPSLEMDHFFPKARTQQTVRNCWALCHSCHRMKTDNRPGAAFWLEAFIAHATRNDYLAEARTARSRLQALELMEQVEVAP